MGSAVASSGAEDTISRTQLEEWRRAQAWERAWWLAQPQCWPVEQRKQVIYAALMQMPLDLDFGERRILDIGCGPVSLLLRAKFHAAFAGDPLDYAAAEAAYRARANIARLMLPAEQFVAVPPVDEVWMYNVLQHVINPRLVLANAAQSALLIRLFDWLDTTPCDGHPHTITEAMVADTLLTSEWDRLHWDVGSIQSPGTMIAGRYLAAVLVRRRGDAPPPPTP